MNFKQISLLSALITSLIIGNAHANQYNIALLSSCFSNMVKNMIPGRSKTSQASETVNEQPNAKNKVRLVNDEIYFQNKQSCSMDASMYSLRQVKKNGVIEKGNYFPRIRSIAEPISSKTPVVIIDNNDITVKSVTEIYEELKNEENDLTHVDFPYSSFLTSCPDFPVVTIAKEKKQDDFEICTDRAIQKAVEEFIEKHGSTFNYKKI